MIRATADLRADGVTRKWSFRALAVALALAGSLVSCTSGAPTDGGGPPPPPGTHFVAPDGDDAAPGSEERPWRTLQVAIDRLEPGNVLVVEDGAYAPVTLNATGAPGQPITIQARNAGLAVINAAGAKRAVGDSGRGLAHVVLDGLLISGAQRGFDLTGDVTGLTVRNCAIQSCEHAFLCARGSSLRLDGVRVTACADGIGLGVKGNSGIDGVEIVDCSTIYDSDAEGEANTDGFRIEGLCTDVRLSGCEAAGFDDSGFDIKPAGALIEACLAHHNWDNGFKLWGSDARLVNCIARDNDDTGVTFAGGAGMYNCTVALNRRAAFRPGGDDITQITVRNTILDGLIRVYSQASGTGVFAGDYNLFYTAPGELLWKTMDNEERRYLLEELAAGVLPLGEHSLFVAPEFADAGARDLRPATGSPLIDAGAPLDFVTTDFSGGARDAQPDIGAYESR